MGLSHSPKTFETGDQTKVKSLNMITLQNVNKIMEPDLFSTTNAKSFH